MILYHGSNCNIEKVLLTMSKPNKDFGRAFYLSEDYAQAEEMANLKCSYFGGNPVVNEFFVDDDIFSCPFEGLKIKIFNSYSFEWARFIWNNRNLDDEFSHDYDIVYGPIADDSVGYQIRMFKSQEKSLEDFLEGLKYSKGITFQYAFCTERSIEFLSKI